MGKLEDLRIQRDKMVEDHISLLNQWPDVKLSYWSFSTYKKCPQQFILHCIGREWRPKEDNYHAIAGSVVHSLMEDFVKENKAGTLNWNDKDFLLDNAASKYDKFLIEKNDRRPSELANPVDWDFHRVTPEEHKAENVPRIIGNLDWTYNKLYQLGILPRDPAQIHQEYSFKTQLISPLTQKPIAVKLTGRVDLVVVDPDGLIIVDYKDVASKSNIDWRQLVWYPLGIEPIFHKRVKQTGFLFTELREWGPRNPDAVNGRDKQIPKRTFRKILFTEILETALAIKREPFTAKLSRHVCGYCPVKSMCPEFYSWKGQEDELMADLHSLSEGEVNL